MAADCENISPYSNEPGEDKTRQVRRMFDSIAPAYDLMNSLMSFGLHKRWLRKAVKTVAAEGPKQVLDVATGTADVAIALARSIEGADVTGIDLSEGMIEIGRKKVEAAGFDPRIRLMQADCLALPFATDSFDAVTVAYGVRNFQDLLAGYKEMHRVMRPGASLTVIELSTPRSPLIKPFYKFYAGCIIPLVGRMVSRDISAYKYLPKSIAAVPQGAEMTALMTEAGFVDTTFQPLTFGTVTIYRARKI